MDRIGAVLCDEWLMRCIASFQRGVPDDVALFAQEAGSAVLAKLAISQNNLRMLQRLHRYHKEQPLLIGGEARTSFEGAWFHAVEYGDLSTLEWVAVVYDLDIDPCSWEVTTALRRHHGRFEVFKWLVTRFPHYKDAMSDGQSGCCIGAERVARLGDLELFKWLEQNMDPFRCTGRAMTEASRSGHVEMVKYLHMHRSEGNPQRAMDVAANLEILQFLYENSTTGFTGAAMKNAARRGQLDMVQYLHERWPDQLSVSAMREAIEGGNVGVVKLMYFQRHERISEDMISELPTLEVIQFCYEHVAGAWPSMLMCIAASNGQLEVVRYLREQTTEGSEEAMRKALRCGQLATVRYLYEAQRQGPTGVPILETPSDDSYFALIQYIHRNGIRGDMRSLCYDAAAKGDTQVVKFLTENSLLAVSHTLTAMEAARYGHWETLQYFLEGFPHVVDVCDLINEAAQGGHFELVRYLHEKYHDESCSPKTMGHAAVAVNGNFRVVKYLSEHCEYSDGAFALYEASKFGEIRIVAYLVETRTDGCLWEALQFADKRFDVMTLLRSEIDASVEACSPTGVPHTTTDSGRRRCQRSHRID